MNIKRLLAALLTMTALTAACEKNPYGPTGHIPEYGSGSEDKESPTTKGEFAKGADISWVTEMEKDGVKFYDASGKEAECTAVLKEAGFNSIRLRVWVNPEEGWCGAEDVLVKARRAKQQGMRLMIDFHYSDTWADPSNQNPPASWKDYNESLMTTAITKHTSDILSRLKEEGIDVEWVQIGNEVNSGMLHPLGLVKDRSTGSFITFLNAGYKTVKGIYPEAKVIAHISNGHEAGLSEWFFNLMKLGGATYDIIGLSLYPFWWENGGWNTWQTPAAACIENIKSITKKYGKPVMLCESGAPVYYPDISKAYFTYILQETEKIDDCHGIFLWEPQTDGVWKPAGYASLGWNAYDKGAFKDGRPTAALDPFKE